MGLEDDVAKTANGRGGSHEKELPPSELWLALMEIPRPKREVPFPRNIPGTDQPIGTLIMWPLTQEEQHNANLAADRYVKELFKDPQKKDETNLGYQNAFTNEVAVQVLHRACRDVANPIERPAFLSTAKMRKHFTTDELGVLFSTYCTVQAELGPIRAHMTKEEEDALILRIVEGGSTFPLDGLSWEAQRALVSSLANRLVNSWTHTLSVGGQPDVSGFARDLLRERAERLAAATTSDEMIDDDSSSKDEN